MSATTQNYWRDSALPFIELRSTYGSVQSYKPHFHPQVSFGAVISGETLATCEGRERVLTQGDLVFIAPHVVHSCNPIEEQPRSYHMLYVDEAWCLENAPVLCSDISVIRDSGLFAQYVEFVARLPEMDATEAAAQLQRLLTVVVDGNAPEAPLPQLRQPAERIRQALLDSIDSPTTLDELAEAFGCRKETLIRIFRRAYHITPRAFVNNARIERAKRQLKRGDEIAHVAADLGFSDQAQLHRTFVSYTASTPGQYRRARPPAINIRQ
ncbi:MAG TPA: AraC family transcriptional regulator [Steroidobacteraceae bacterium]|jgi:AraC-like DNA-binding protein